jgi:hypothetical protein
MANTEFIFDEFKEVNENGLWLNNKSMWGEKYTGTNDSLSDPSFLDNPILNVFFFKNRLGFITKNNIILSQTGAYGSFFPQTLQEVLDDDPIDLGVATTAVTILRHAVPTAGQLLIFSDDTQFSLTSIEGTLTPKSADITVLSNYTYGPSADAIAVGNRILFANQIGGYSQIYAYRITDQGSNLTEAEPLSLHVPSYIDNSISRIVGHDVMGYTFLETEDNPQELIVINTTYKGGQYLQNAFHKWFFKKPIASTHIINNNLFILFQDGDLCEMSLEIPGVTINDIYVDVYSKDMYEQDFESAILFSKFYFRDSQGKGTVRGRYQIRTLQYTILKGSKYLTTIYNTDHLTRYDDDNFGPTWDDDIFWDDTLMWTDNQQVVIRKYETDDKVTVSSENTKAIITFKNSEEYPYRGFELATVNVEALFSQRSLRR